jgi:nitrogen fixation/metabolism regulation signal transduction histidine kinase
MEKAKPVSSPKMRRPNGVLIRPRQQFRYAFVLVAGGILTQSLVVGILIYFINSTVANVIDSNHLSPEIGSTITGAISLALVLIMVVALALALVAVLIGVKLSHRIYGPLVPFTRHIEQLKAGNYSARIKLRKTDDLGELRDELNDLASVLEDRYSSVIGKQAL